MKIGCHTLTQQINSTWVSERVRGRYRLARNRHVDIPAYGADRLLVGLRCLWLLPQTLTFAHRCKLSSSAASSYSLACRGLAATMRQGRLRHPFFTRPSCSRRQAVDSNVQ